jgi:hypothetical protein
MKKSNTSITAFIKADSGMNAILGALSVKTARYLLNHSPTTLFQHCLKYLLNRSKFLRKKIMTIANNCMDELDLYNLQAIEILEKAGISEPTDRQITTIERLLKAT